MSQTTKQVPLSCLRSNRGDPYWTWTKAKMRDVRKEDARICLCADAVDIDCMT